MKDFYDLVYIFTGGHIRTLYAKTNFGGRIMELTKLMNLLSIREYFQFYWDEYGDRHDFYELCDIDRCIRKVICKLIKTSSNKVEIFGVEFELEDF
jgi:hypothetical protein